MARVRDPVCHTMLDSEDAAASRSFGGSSFHFCSADCARRFDAAPERYSAAAEDDLERHEPPFTTEGGFTAPKFGSAGSGGAEYERLPERHERDPE